MLVKINRATAATARDQDHRRSQRRFGRLQITTEDTVPQRLERHPNKKTAGLTDSPFVDSWG
jgi:hypothetical protein